MKHARTISLAVLSAAVLGVVGIAATSLAAKPGGGGGGGGPRLCPDVYAPVLCPNGKVYPNSCYAERAGQTNCVPYGPI